jgi:hypothetical protein
MPTSTYLEILFLTNSFFLRDSHFVPFRSELYFTETLAIPRNEYFFRGTTKTVPVPEFIDPVFMKTSPKRSFSVIQNERFGLVFAKNGSIILGTGLFRGTFSELNYHGNLKLKLVE